ncbi:MAG TPA: apolipoprotein N-acyltransferase [Chitinophagaceae bacterium]
MKTLILIICFALLTYCTWYVTPYFVFFQFIPVFLLIRSEKTRSIILPVYLMMYLYNHIVTYWLQHYAFYKGLLTFLVNAALMTIVITLSHRLSRNRPFTYKGVLFISAWIVFEYLHFSWELSWPWLTLGNVLGSVPGIIQWYEFTGTLGGSVWILLLNFLFSLLLVPPERARLNATGIVTAVVIVLPTLLSFGLYYREQQNADYAKTDATAELLIVHSNFSSSTYQSDETRLGKFKQLIENQIDSTTDYLIFPELFLSNGAFINNVTNQSSYFFINNLTQEHPKLKTIVGTTIKRARRTELLTGPINESSYDQFNSAIQVDSGFAILHKMKKKFIPFEERIPYNLNFLNFKSANFETLPKNPDVFRSSGHSPLISICYESINTTFVAEAARDADFIVMMASESFFKGNADGKDQYLTICRIRSIETRKPVVKVSNAGYSALIDPAGNIEMAYKKKQPSVIHCSLSPAEGSTFYMRFPYLTGTICLILSIVLIALPYVRILQNTTADIFRRSVKLARLFSKSGTQSRGI